MKVFTFEVNLKKVGYIDVNVIFCSRIHDIFMKHSARLAGRRRDSKFKLYYAKAGKNILYIFLFADKRINIKVIELSKQNCIRVCV